MKRWIVVHQIDKYTLRYRNKVAKVHVMLCEKCTVMVAASVGAGLYVECKAF